MTTFRVGSATDTGRVRANNQDSKLVGADLFAVADGMGGHQGGEVASAIAVETLQSAVIAPTAPGLVEAVQAANRAIYEQSATDPDLRGMGTTLCALAVIESGGAERLLVVNVGDSRAYRFHEGDLSQLTRDHSLVEDLRAEGRLTDEEAEVHPHRNILTRALGIDPEVEVDQLEEVPQAGDRYLLCSDGLFNEVSPDRIGATLRRIADPDEAARELVRLANEHGGRDNVTVVLVDVVDGAPPTATGGAAATSVAADDTADSPTLLVPAPGPAAQVAPEEDLAGFSTAPPPEAGEADGTPAEEKAPPPPKRPRRFTWRVGLFVILVIAILGAAVASVGWYARRTYYVGVRNGEVTIYKGRPGGALWFDPTVEERTGVKLEQMPAQYRDELRHGVDESSVGAAHRYIRKLQGIAAAQGLGSTTAGSTTTVAPGHGATSTTIHVPPPAPGTP